MPRLSTSIKFICIRLLLPLITSTSTSTSTNGLSSTACNTHTVNLPLTVEYDSGHASSFSKSFQGMVESTEFFIPSPTAVDSGCECSVPLFNNAQVLFQPIHCNGKTPHAYAFAVNGASKSEFGWICKKLHECMGMFNCFDDYELQMIVVDHFNSLPPLPGYAASETANDDLMQNVFQDNTRAICDALSKDGYVILDDILKTSASSNSKLSNFLTEKTDHDKSIRSDTIAFLNREMATNCGLKTHYDTLLAIASHLNAHMDIPDSEFSPMHPGTENEPLTNPLSIQAAEYGEGEFYVAHSDNSLTDTGTRNNIRHFTCILYCNEGWKEEYGGSLRLYPNTQHLRHPKEAKDVCNNPIDVFPLNGRLIIFDSRLVHSVEKVHGDRLRQALTLWITRPLEGAGVKGETWSVALKKR